jgi:hypothetical protein
MYGIEGTLSELIEFAISGPRVAGNELPWGWGADHNSTLKELDSNEWLWVDATLSEFD